MSGVAASGERQRRGRATIEMEDYEVDIAPVEKRAGNECMICGEELLPADEREDDSRARDEVDRQWISQDGKLMSNDDGMWERRDGQLVSKSSELASTGGDGQLVVGDDDGGDGGESRNVNRLTTCADVKVAYKEDDVLTCAGRGRMSGGGGGDNESMSKDSGCTSDENSWSEKTDECEHVLCRQCREDYVLRDPEQSYAHCPFCRQPNDT